MSAKHTLLRLIDESGKRMQHLSAYEFYTAWQKYDSDGSGYIESKELEGFLKEFLTTIAGVSSHESLTPQGMKDLATAFLNEHDRDRDGRISIQELSALLPTDQTFLLIFRFDNPLESSEDFMKAWKKYDADKSGSIDTNELKAFLKEILAAKKLDDKTLGEYAKNIIEIFDANKDGHLSLSEASQLLPVKENFLRTATKNTDLGKLTQQQIAQVFKQYDRDGSGYISASEIDGLCSDLLRLSTKSYGDAELKALKDSVIKGCDVDGDGKIDQKELSMIIAAVSKAAA
ncbi:Calbindin-32 [Hypsibius exemplaris]|uniref:Calbindin-32 n=1 Tax=Hypsibius exemplaris TaxID=2072580 RepID=A0A1W0WG30_HYPEX|nr:Calbindin-32 [Hypsibius exemplaris]